MNFYIGMYIGLDFSSLNVVYTHHAQIHYEQKSLTFKIKLSSQFEDLMNYLIEM